ncbi:hypothetical protein GUITHDRAFT_116039 [Guillardia theta CCMP2712]|uniref:Uncharacterized protein n=1 Tax=Guillardia theta (strain CCMP2712) TaxID=905079 RepID=L1IPC4_GUITC|nr:hypothetical protein GUITHDRAFT_116039 [Guillardia theta CCMP2712]EKX37734.1 hypothetical protein GUITHDRAFT_116039 [Guillardia theta CCMP2712]|eukprot:XP_005824714.1 hypothetical protein GUITHDRAFT_116039 [Guillardia theta CCMP2712]
MSQQCVMDWSSAGSSSPSQSEAEISAAADEEAWNYSLFDFILAHDAASSFDANVSFAPVKRAPKVQPHASKRWSTLEHQRFLVALDMYHVPGREGQARGEEHGSGLGRGAAKKISDFVQTRSEAQVRSHAQKYFAQRRNRS